MAEKIAEPIIDDAARAAANAKVIQEQKDQNIEGKLAGGASGYANTVDALDALRDGIVEKKKEIAEIEAGTADVQTPEEKAAEEKVAADKAAADAAAAPEAKAAADKVAADAAAAKAVEDTAAQKITDELFKEAPSLPPNASPKSKDAFNEIKARASKEVSRLQSELENLTKEAKELRERSKESMTPELRKELESHREFRLRLDIETDPKFKEFDKGITAAQEFIYAQLKKSPVITDEVIAEIKKHGGPDKVKMDKILEAIGDPTIQRLVEAKLADVELSKYNKDQAIASNKADTRKYLEERSKQWEASASSHNTKTKAQLDGLIVQIPWLNQVKVDEKADATAKAAADAHNKFAEKLKGELQQAMEDDTPEMRATLLVGMAQLFRLQGSYEILTKERDTMKKSLEDANATIARLKTSSTSRLKESGQPAGGGAPPKKDEFKIGVRAGDALDQIRAEKARVAGQT